MDVLSSCKGRKSISYQYCGTCRDAPIQTYKAHMQQTDFKCPIYRHDRSLPILLLDFTAQYMKLSGYSFPRTAAQVATMPRKREGRNKGTKKQRKKAKSERSKEA
jgi:hypothetical protein